MAGMKGRIADKCVDPVAILRAMREPTPEMMEIAKAKVDLSHKYAVRQLWNAMVDAALKGA